MEQQTFRQAVVRVAFLEGGTEQLAVLLGVSPGLVTKWIEGLAPVPTDIFLRCCDYLAEHNEPPADESEKPHLVRRLRPLWEMPSRFFPDANPLRGLAWSTAAVAAVLSAFAYYAALFGVGRFDLVVHAVTAAALTLLLAAYMRAMLPGVWRPASYVAALVALGVAIGTAWEVGEWLYDALTDGNAIRGKIDTMTDLVADALGALLAALTALAVERRHVKASGAPL